MKAARTVSLLAYLLLFSTVSIAGDVPVGDPVQPGRERPGLPGYLPETPGTEFVLPPAPKAPGTFSGKPVFELKGVAFEGNTVFSDRQLNAVAEPFLGRPAGPAELEELRYRLTRFYVDAGYVNSGAVLKPNQKIEDGVVVFVIREGKLSEIRVSGTGALRPGYVKKRLWPDPEAVFNAGMLQERFQLLLQDPLIRRMDGRIRPGLQPGEALLDLDVAREKPYELGLSVDNHRPPSTGATGVMASGAWYNPAGIGDAFEGGFGGSKGAKEVRVEYTVPLHHLGTRLSLGYSMSENAVVEEPLEPLDIESEATTTSLTVAHPVYRSLRRSLEVGAGLAARSSETSLLDRPFSFSPGAEAGKSSVTALRLTQTYLDRTPVQALAFRSTFSFGVDLFHPTVHSDGRPDGRFFSWLGQFQYARRLRDVLGQVIVRGDLQLADDDLLPLERFAVGGADSVRGYRENELVRDNGCALSVEWRIPLWTHIPEKGPSRRVHIAPFMDYGMSWNQGEDPEDHRLHSAGVGLLWESRGIDAALYVAHSIEDTASHEEHNLQDDGIHFRCRIHLF